MKTYLVTGGCGFIGSNFISFLFKKYKNIKVINLDCLTYAGKLKNVEHFENNSNYNFVKASITNRKAVRKIFNENEIDFVVNFAAESHVDRSIKNPTKFFKTNVFGTLVLLEEAKRAWATENGYKKGKKFLQISTDEVYGSLTENSNEFFTENSRCKPTSPYAASKTSADMLVNSFVRTYNFPANISRCTNNYGPNQYPEKLIPYAFKCCCELKPIKIHGDGLQVRDWIFVDDHCSAIDAILNCKYIGETFNVGSHNEKKNLEIANQIIDFVKTEINSKCSSDLLTFVTDRPCQDVRYAIDYQKIQNMLGWKPETPFEIGFINTLTSYKQEYLSKKK